MAEKQQRCLPSKPADTENPENKSLQEQRNQLGVLLGRLGAEVASWRSLENEGINSEQWSELDINREDEIVENQENTGSTEKIFTKMQSKVLRMAVQVEQIQHSLEASKRAMVVAEANRSVLSSKVHSASQYGNVPQKGKAASLIRGFLSS